MAVSGVDSGFFNANGVIRSDALKSSDSQKAETQRSAAEKAETQSSSGDPATAAIVAAAQQITEAAVVAISSRLNVGGSGFDQGVADAVGQAVISALSKRSAAPESSENSGSARREIGGTYQNQIMAGTKVASEATEAAAAENPAAVEAPEKDPPPNRARGRGRGGSYQNEILAKADAARGKSAAAKGPQRESEAAEG